MGTWLVRGNARSIPLADESVQCVVTSPPYWGLRKYAGEQELVWDGQEGCPHQWMDETIVGQPVRFSDKSGLWRDGRSEDSRMHSVTEAASKIGGQPTQFVRGTCIQCGAWRGAYGLEPTVEMYVQHTVEILREVRRVLRKDGVCFWNIADSYYQGNKGNSGEIRPGDKQGTNRGSLSTRRGADIGPNRKGGAGDSLGIKAKDLCLIPQRVALAVQIDGWWVRSGIIWSKPNPMPESVRDRPTDAYEHVLMLTKNSSYYWNPDAVREPHKEISLRRIEKGLHHKHPPDVGVGIPPVHTERMGERFCHPNGRNLRNVWTFPTQPYKGAHFATFPEELPRRCIKAATKPGDLVLDPFAGSGTVGKVAKELGRNAVLLDIAYSPGAYKELAEKRISNTQQSFI